MVGEDSSFVHWKFNLLLKCQKERWLCSVQRPTNLSKMCNVQCAMCTVHSVHYATMRIAQYAVCNIPICNVPCQVCSVSQCAIFSMQRRPDQTLQYSLAPNEVCSSLIKSIFSTCIAFSLKLL